jgi:hypothetical protein
MTIADGSVALASDIWDALINQEVGGSGDLGQLNVTSGTTNLSLGVWYQYSLISISNGATLSTSDSNSGLPMLIMCSGNCTINGTINLKGKGWSGGGTVGGITPYGICGNGYNSYIAEGDYSDQRYIPLGTGGVGAGNTYGGSSASDPGTGGRKIPNGFGIFNKNYKFLYIPNGTGGGGGCNGYGVGGGGGGGGSSWNSNGSNGITGGGGTGGGGNGGNGGAGGASLILLVKGNLTIGATGIIDCRGDNGSDASPSGDEGGGGGGGGGGSIYIIYDGTLSDSGSKLVTGGSGGTGGSGSPSGGAGGSGANGTATLEQV